MGRDKEAISHLNEVSALLPQDFQARIGVADLFLDKGMLEESLESYSIAASLNPKNAKVQARMGRIFFDKNSAKMLEILFLIKNI